MMDPDGQIPSVSNFVQAKYGIPKVSLVSGIIWIILDTDSKKITKNS